MSVTQFFIVSVCVNILLCGAIHFRNYKNKLTIPMVCAAIALPLIPFSGIYFFTHTLNSISFHIVLFFLISGVTLLTDMSSQFMRKEHTVVHYKNVKVGSRSLIYLFGTGNIIVAFFSAWNMVFIRQYTVFFQLGYLETLLLLLLISQSIYGVYIIEKTYRCAMEYQRRVGQLCFIAFFALFTFKVVFLANILLYRTLDILWLYTALSINGIIYPLLLLGFFRYRLGLEEVTINRNTVYTSVSLVLSGGAFLGVGLFVYMFKLFKLDMQYFEKSLILTALSIGIVMVINSGAARREIIKFVNNRFYRNKYDYKEQFFLLYKTYITGGNLQESLTCMVENMKYAVVAVDAFVFIKNNTNNVFIIHRNPEFATNERMILSGNEFPESLFQDSAAHLDFKNNRNGAREKKLLATPCSAIKTLAPTLVFPILHENALLGLLMVKLDDSRKIDSEDIALIEVFTSSLGAMIFRNNLAMEKIEREQFQSYHQVVSFVIHDIKNQTATLSLLAKNADKYIENKDFQQSLVRSITNCSKNLTELVGKLTTQRDTFVLKSSVCDIRSIVENALEECSIEMYPNINVTWVLQEECQANVDNVAMKYIVVNLIKNAIEAMKSNGTLRISVGKINSVSNAILTKFGLSHEEQKQEKIIIIFEDSGPGMSPDFLDTYLFKPFKTTKDKGMGIGLYQSKLTVERMGGRIYCDSIENSGTSFCIVI